MKNIIIAIIVIGIIGGGVWFVKNREVSAPVVENTTPATSVANETTNPSVTTSTSTGASLSTVKTFTLAEIATHKDASSCWTTIRTKVYDVTSFTTKHPGGSGAILSLCGKDGTSGFVDQHGNQLRPNEKLDSFYLGELAK